MKTFKLPGTKLTVPAIVAGMMRIAKMSDQDIRKLVSAAIADGIYFFDHADIYGGESHTCEGRFGNALKLTTSQRESLILQTKCGIVRGEKHSTFDFSYEHILEAVDGSLKALRTDYIDILLLHRPDALMEPDEVAKAFDTLHHAGKVNHFGVSNFTPGQIRLLKQSIRQPLVANQVQISLTHCPAIAQGLTANMSWLDESVDRDCGLLDYCRRLGITLQAWSPFQNPDWTGTFVGNPEQPELNAVLDRLAAEYQVTPTAIATAWITRHPAKMQVVTGTTDPVRLHQIALGSEVVLTRKEWYELFQAAGYTIP